MYQSSEYVAYWHPNRDKMESTLCSEPIRRSAFSVPADTSRPAVDPTLPKINREKTEKVRVIPLP